jgi:hypothetical protein
MHVTLTRENQIRRNPQHLGLTCLPVPTAHATRRMSVIQSNTSGLFLFFEEICRSTALSLFGLFSKRQWSYENHYFSPGPRLSSSDPGYPRPGYWGSAPGWHGGSTCRAGAPAVADDVEWRSRLGLSSFPVFQRPFHSTSSAGVVEVTTPRARSSTAVTNKPRPGL